MEKSIEQCQPFINIARHFQLISEMSVNDLATLGHSLLSFHQLLMIILNLLNIKQSFGSTTVNGASGNGYSNNRVFASTSR